MIERVTDRIWLIGGGKEGRYPYSHSLYVRDGGGVLVDCGSDLNDILKIREEWGLARIVMTHYHEDHFLFLHHFPDVEIWASQGDAPALQSLETLLDRYGIPGGPEEGFFRKLFAEKFPFRPRTAARLIDDRESLRFGRTEAIAVVAPGHTPGHLCLHFPSEGVLFLADYDLTGFGPWYGDKPCDIVEFRRSAAMLSEIGAAVHVVSHEEAIHRGSISEKMIEYLSVIDRREEALGEFLRQPRTREEIVAKRIAYGQERKGPWFDYGEWALMSKHLSWMLARGEAARDGERYALTLSSSAGRSAPGRRRRDSAPCARRCR